MREVWVTRIEEDYLTLGHYYHERPKLFGNEKVEALATIVKQFFRETDIKHFDNAPSEFFEGLSYSETTSLLMPCSPATDLLSGKMGGTPSKERCVRVCVLPL